MGPNIASRGSSLKVVPISTRSTIPSVAPLNVQKVAKSETTASPTRHYESETDTSSGDTLDGSPANTIASSYSEPVSSILAPAECDLHRFQRVYEFYYTELQFARDMGCLVQIYLPTSIQSGLPFAERSILFMHLTEIFNSSLKLLAALEVMVPRPVLAGWSCLADAPPANCVTLVGCALSEILTPELYATYEAYLRNSPRQMRLCFELVTKRPGRVGWWLDECHARSRLFTNAWSLDALLIRPVQQLGRYLLFMKAILKVTPRDHADYDGLLKAHNKIARYIESLDKRVKL